MGSDSLRLNRSVICLIIIMALICLGSHLGCSDRKVGIVGKSEITSNDHKKAGKGPHDDVSDLLSQMKSPFSINLTARGPEKRDSINLFVEIVNVSQTPIGFDSEFSVFLIWRLVDEKNQGIDPVEIVPKIKKTDEQIRRKRFATLEPGEKLTKQFSLTKPFRMFRIEPFGIEGTDKNIVRSVGYEMEAKFSIPLDTKQLKIELEYDSMLDGEPAFLSLFGYKAAEVELWHGNSKSNQITVNFDN
jgi:hypothetical protein